jgi:hypothetical protein
MTKVIQKTIQTKKYFYLFIFLIYVEDFVKNIKQDFAKQYPGIYSAGEADVSYANFAKQHSQARVDRFWTNKNGGRKTSIIQLTKTPNYKHTN